MPQVDQRGEELGQPHVQAAWEEVENVLQERPDVYLHKVCSGRPQRTSHPFYQPGGSKKEGNVLKRKYDK